MKPKKRQKLCCNCDGEIDLDVIVCPYCAADLREEKPEQQRSLSPGGNVRPLSGGQQMAESLYPSPPSPRDASDPTPLAETAVQQSAPVEEEKPNRTIGATLLFTVGVQLFVLGLLLALCSSHGSVVLKWDARLWFLYVFASIPFLVLGYRSLSRL